MYLRCGGERGGGPERADDICLAKILVLRLRCRAGGWDFRYKARIKATKLVLEPPDWYWSLKASIALGPSGLGWSLQGGVGALTLEFEPPG